MKTRPLPLANQIYTGAGALICGLCLLLPQNLLAQPMPHHFSSITVGDDGTVSLRLDGSVSDRFNLTDAIRDEFMQMSDLYVVEASANLVDWTRLAMLSRTNDDLDPLLFQDTDAASGKHRFYRTFADNFITGFPKPTGPFAVGAFSRVLTDPSRSDRYGIEGNSSFMSTFWYPAESAAAGSIPASTIDREVVADENLYSFWGWPLEWKDLAPEFVDYALADAPLASGQDRFPIIVHSHGWTCDREYNSQRAAELASHGYIVASVDHEDAHATVFPDERGARFTPPGSRFDFSTLLESRVNDVRFLLGELSRIQSTDPVLKGRLDLDRIGALGFSFGGGTVAETSRLDSRLKCAAIMDGFFPAELFDAPLFPDLHNEGLQKPFISINRTILDHSDILFDFAPESESLFNLASENAFWFKIMNTGHFSFCDFAWTVETNSDNRRAALAINDCLLWFFDTYLNGEQRPFPQMAEITDLLTK